MAEPAQTSEKIKIKDIQSLLVALNGRSREEIAEAELGYLLDEAVIVIAEYDKTKKGSPSDIPDWLLSEIVENHWQNIPIEAQNNKHLFLKAISDNLDRKDINKTAPKISALAVHDPESAIFFLDQLDEKIFVKATKKECPKERNKTFLKELLKNLSQNPAASTSIYSYLPESQDIGALNRCKNAAWIFLEAILKQKEAQPKVLAEFLVWFISLKQFLPDDENLLKGIKEKIASLPPKMKEEMREKLREKGCEDEWQSIAGKDVLTGGKGSAIAESLASKNASLSTPVCALSDAKDPETIETQKSEAINTGFIPSKDDVVAQTEPAKSDTQKPSEKIVPNDSALWRETLRKTDECYRNLLGLLDECLKYGTANALAQREEYRQKIAELERELAKSANRIIDIEKKLEAEKNNTQELKEKYVQYGERIETLKEERKDLARKLSEKEKELDGKREEVAKLRDDLAQAQAEMHRQQENLTEKLAESERRRPFEFNRGKKEIAREITDRLKKNYMDMDALSDNEENRLAKENMLDIFSRLAEFGITF